LHTTAKPPQAIEKSPFGASVLATIAVDKFARHLPLYRQQESLLGPLRTWLSRPLMCRLVGGIAGALRPLPEIHVPLPNLNRFDLLLSLGDLNDECDQSTTVVESQLETIASADHGCRV
jgi:hypothetical protein